jgi:hypothetical protein
MAINLDAIKSRLQEMQKSANSGGGSGVSEFLWKPPVGKSQIRIVPYAFDKSNPFIEMFFHYEIGKRTMVSPTSFGRPDPIVEFAEKLKRSGNKEDWKLGKKIEPKFRCYVPVIIRGEEEKGVRFWSFGKQIYQELLGVIADPDLLAGRHGTTYLFEIKRDNKAKFTPQQIEWQNGWKGGIFVRIESIDDVLAL